MAKHLVPGEQVLVRTRGQFRFAPAIRFIVLALIAGLWQGFMSRPDLLETFDYFRSQITLIGNIILLIVLIPAVIKPLWEWFGTVHELTTQRVAQRIGVINIRRRWMALGNIAHVQLNQTRRQRFHGAGDVRLYTQDGRLWILHNVPEVQEFIRLIEVERHQNMRDYSYR